MATMAVFDCQFVSYLATQGVEMVLRNEQWVGSLAKIYADFRLQNRIYKEKMLAVAFLLEKSAFQHRWHIMVTL